MFEAMGAGRECLFCNASLSNQSRSVEHIFAQWLLDYLDIMGDDQLLQAVADSGDGTIIDTRQHATRRLVEGRICEECNTGWMSKLENAAKPALIELMEHRTAVWQLSHGDRLAVARWTAKTCYLLSYASPAGLPVRREFLHELWRSDGLPETAAVFGMQSKYSRPYSFLVRTEWYVMRRATSAVLSKPPDGAHKISVQLRHLMLLVAHWPQVDPTFIVAQGAHVPIWPIPEGLLPSYAIDLQGPADSFAVFAAFNNTLGVVAEY